MSKQTRIDAVRETTKSIVKTLSWAFGVTLVATGALSLAIGIATPIMSAVIVTVFSLAVIGVLHALEVRRIRREPMP